MHGEGILSAKGRVKWPYRHLPSLLEQMPMRPLDERSEPVKPKVLRVSARTYRKPKKKSGQLPKAEARANAQSRSPGSCPKQKSGQLPKAEARANVQSRSPGKCPKQKPGQLPKSRIIKSCRSVSAQCPQTTREEKLCRNGVSENEFYG